jgi:hypothetical protein
VATAIAPTVTLSVIAVRIIKFLPGPQFRKASDRAFIPVILTSILSPGAFPNPLCGTTLWSASVGKRRIRKGPPAVSQRLYN